MPSVYVDDRRPEQHAQGWRIKVGWLKAPKGIVQVGSLGPMDPDRPHAADGPSGNGWFIELDREGINQLIHTLRQARDGAFGKDA